MKRKEIFSELMALRQRIISENEEPMLDSDDSLLWAVAHALGLSELQADALAGNTKALLHYKILYDILGQAVWPTMYSDPIASLIALEKLVSQGAIRRCGFRGDYENDLSKSAMIEPVYMEQ